ncbi:MAG: GNAT family N-acetyltransferase [Rhizobiaceae bacterium]|nr:GNAT family N-acetyltransferase [Rhizobiaceae bacterium]
MEIRHVRIGDQDQLDEKHPELTRQYPDQISPNFAVSDSHSRDFTYLFYAIENGQIASYIRSFPDTLFHEGRPHKWAWNSGLFTEPSFRGRGLAGAIIEQQLEEFSRQNLVWGGVFSSPAALRLYERLDFYPLEYSPRLCLIRNIKPFLHHHISNHIISSGGNFVYKLGFSVIQKFVFRPPHTSESSYIEQVTPEQFSALLSKYSIYFPEKFHWEHDASWFLERRKRRNIDKIYTIRLSSAREPNFFIFIRSRTMEKNPIKNRYHGVKMMSVMEFGQFQSYSNFPKHLIEAVLKLFSKSDADMMEFVTSSPSIIKAARKSGFFPIGAGMSFRFKAPKGHPLENMPVKPSDYHLSHYSGDAFGFE